MISETLTNIYKKIEEAGVSGLRRTQLIKEFGKDAPNQLEELISQGLIYSAKKRNSIIYWTKNNYAINESSKKELDSSRESSIIELKKRVIEQDAKLDALEADMRQNIKEIYAILNSINEKITSDKSGDIINNLDSRLEEIKRDSISAANQILNNRIDTLTKEHNELANNIEKRLADEITTLTRSLEGKASVDKLGEMEKSISNMLERYATDTRANIERLESNIQTLGEHLNNKADTKLLVELTDSITKLEHNINVLNSRLEEIKNDNTLRDKLLAINNRIDTLTKEHNELANNIEKRLADEITTLTRSLEGKASVDKLGEMEKSISSNIKQLDLLDKKISNISKNVNERLDRLLRQISGKADDIKVFEMERKVESLLQVEAKLSTLEDMVESLDNNIKEVREEMGKSIALIRAELQSISNGNGTSYDTISLDQFKMEFDRTLAESSTSIGWIELAEIRSKVCEKYGISKSTFYALVSQLLDTYDQLYELSSGGREGVMIRGLIHGFIRRI